MNNGHVGEYHRSTVDWLVLMIAGTVCFAVLAAGATVALLEIRDSTVDTTGIVSSLADVINTLIGLMAGFLAGRAQWGRTGGKRVSEPDDTPPMDAGE